MIKKQKIGQKSKKKLKDRVNHHICHHYHKNFHVAHHAHHTAIHIGELALVLLVGCMSWMFAGSVGLPSNSSFVYPVQQVSTIECRTQYRGEMEVGCQINIPKIVDANYGTYQDSIVHKQIYTVLWAAPYKDAWNQNVGAHAGVDIATARGTPLFSIGDGQVTYAGRQNGYGNVVKIKYLFQGKYIHAIYAHMDTIEVEAGNKISAGSRIGTVGNSGTTFGALGGFHVHFEINKDNGGRPMYAYLNCPDLNKGHKTIIQEGLCREQLLANQYDPIVLFEQNRLGNVIKDQNTIQEDKIDEVIVDNKENEESSSIEEQQNGNNKKEDEGKKEVIEHNSPSIPEEIVNKIEDNQYKEKTNTVSNNEENVNVKLDKIKETHTETVTSSDTIVPQINVGTGRIGEKIEINTADLSEEIIHFFNTHDLYINNHTGANTLEVGEKKLIEINFYPKGSNNKFVGVLPFALDIIPSQTNVITDYSTIQLVSTNPTTLAIQGQSNGSSVLIISIDNKNIIKIPYTVK